ncbi:MAG: GGDEF domain-containing protein [Nitrospira sp.]
MSSFFKLAWQCVVPGGLIFFAALGFLRPHGLPTWLQPPIAALPVIVLAFGIVFGWYLSSSRLILSLIVLALADRSIMLFPPHDPGPDALGPVLFAVTAFLVPLNLLALSLVKDGAVSTWRGILRLALILSQPFLALWVCVPEHAQFAIPLQHPILPLETGTWTPIPQPALLAYGSAAFLLAMRFALYRDALDAGTLWTLLTSCLSLHGLQYGWNPTNFLSAAGLILFLTVVQSAHHRTYRDDLTGALGQVAYHERLATLKGRFTIAVVGIDQLKQFGNQYGKPVAEQILRILGPKVVKAAGTANVYRLAGEEFTLVFPKRTTTETIATLEHVRKAVGTTALFVRKKTRVWEGRAGESDIVLPISLSVGVAESSDTASTIALVTKAAYRALYEAKGEGGNIIKRGTSLVDTPKPVHTPTGRIVSYSEFES